MLNRKIQNPVSSDSIPICYLLLYFKKENPALFCKPDNRKRPDKIQMLFSTYTSSGPGCYDYSCTDSLSTNFLLMKADRYHCSTDRAFYFNNAFNLFRICVKQSFIFTTWTSHMHFLHNFAS